jgi:hypothetical protein
VITCAVCWSGDQVRTVRAVLLDGHTHSVSSGAVVGAVGAVPMVGAFGQRGWAMTDTARLLAPPPLPPPRTGWYAWIAVLTMYCLCWVSLGVASWPDAPAGEDQRDLWAGVVAPAVFAVPGMIALGLVVAALIRRRRKDAIWRRVAPHVAWLHERAWYCGRCAGAFFLRGTVPDSAPTGALIPIARFRDTLWLIGHQQRQSNEPIGAARRSLGR